MKIHKNARLTPKGREILVYKFSIYPTHGVSVV